VIELPSGLVAPAPSSTGPDGIPVRPPVAVATCAPSRYRACPAISTAWCQAPLLTVPGEDMVVHACSGGHPPKPLSLPPETHSSGIRFPVPDPPGRPGVTARICPVAAVVLNHTLTASDPFGPPSTRPLSLVARHELTCPGVAHHSPSITMNELVPLNDVAVTPGMGPTTPGVVPNSAAGGSSVVRSLTGTWLAAVVGSARSFSR
jgi:hypothetical protein